MTTNILQDGVTWLGGQLKDHCGLSVTYCRGQMTVAITATATMHEYEVVDLDGIVTVMTVRDYVVHAADIVLGGSTATPRAGDRIKETIGTAEQTFEVVPLGSAREHEQMDPDGTLLKIHTKRVT